MSAVPSPVALVTGASSGIGRATALLLARSGFRVFATVRTAEAEESLRREAGAVALEVVRLDLADEAAVTRTMRDILDRAGRMDALVNNAGYGHFGATEDLTRDDLRRQFEVNVFAAMQLCREVLPTMRAQRSGRIVNVSSIAGRVSVPLMGAYCASKFALEAFSDALRVEAKPFGVHVALVEPGPVATRFQETAQAASRATLEGPSVYRPIYERILRDGGPGYGASAERVAKVILAAIRSPLPRARYRVRWRETVLAGIVQVLPRSAMDWGTSRWIGFHRIEAGGEGPA